MVVRVIGPGDKCRLNKYINVTSHSDNWSYELSPFFLGPVVIPYGPTTSMLEKVELRLTTVKSEIQRMAILAIKDGIKGQLKALNVENAWQYSKVYDHHDQGGEPIPEWFQWRHSGFHKRRAVRYPYKKGTVPLYTWYDGKRLTYVEARQQLYIPMYSQAVKKTDAYRRLQGLYTAGHVTLWDFDGYDHHSLGMSFNDVIQCETRRMGHAFVLAMMLEGVI